MKPRSLPVLLSICVGATACSGGPPAPPALEYGLSQVADLQYDVADTTSVGVSVMGQNMALGQEGTALFAVRLAPAAAGIDVTLTVEEMAVVVSQPLGAPIRLDESDIQGPLVYSLDRQGNATVAQVPEVRDEASQMISGLALAHGFLPGLPGRALQPGESWVDTVSFEGLDGPGSRSETSVVRYTVLGDTVVEGRSLLSISMDGSTTTSNDMEISGMTVSQTSELELDGHLLWDLSAGLMIESRRSASGSGTVRVPVAPAPLPIEIRTTRHTRLR